MQKRSTYLFARSTGKQQTSRNACFGATSKATSSGAPRSPCRAGSWRGTPSRTDEGKQKGGWSALRNMCENHKSWRAYS